MLTCQCFAQGVAKLDERDLPLPVYCERESLRTSPSGQLAKSDVRILITIPSSHSQSVDSPEYWAHAGNLGLCLDDYLSGVCALGLTSLSTGPEGLQTLFCLHKCWHALPWESVSPTRMVDASSPGFGCTILDVAPV